MMEGPAAACRAGDVLVRGARCAVLLPAADCGARGAVLVAVFAVRQRWRGR